MHEVEDKRVQCPAPARRREATKSRRRSPNRSPPAARDDHGGDAGSRQRPREPPHVVGNPVTVGQVAPHTSATRIELPCQVG